MSDKKAIPLEAAIRAYERSQWRKCRDVLPEKCGIYLVIRFVGDLGSALHYDAEFKGWNLDLSAGCLLDLRLSEMFPSHWCEMPEPSRLEYV